RTTEYRMAAATTAKMTMQIVTTNQKTKSIRPASFEAEMGIHGIASATAAATPPATTPIPSSDPIEPLRIRFWSLTEAHPEPRLVRSVRERRSYGSLNRNPARSRGRCPCVRGECHDVGREHPRGRLDPAHRRHHRDPPVDDLLVVVGRPRLLDEPAQRPVRRRRAAALLGREAYSARAGARRPRRVALAAGRRDVLQRPAGWRRSLSQRLGRSRADV